MTLTAGFHGAAMSSHSPASRRSTTQALGRGKGPQSSPSLWNHARGRLSPIVRADGLAGWRAGGLLAPCATFTALLLALPFPEAALPVASSG
ncbi:uncharacterized protein SPSK_08162 [Sporothrix schenckii 1099-18]|uniref:Uncharacterized protein n=1 Tax=Sporothrix schenckii 1099-18 TaxID=1397361 RepID=A0A0F2MHH2_SPOSC|nr:uncharacterized protein SPSK_08162 [Sporothrix schenckii 1099-18]KJR88310.1 hypothetical protein SPSK_08162 [Sporothrix schenckii 1099-18]